MKKVLVSIGVVIVSATLTYGQDVGSRSLVPSNRAMLDQYCVLCHDDVEQRGA